MVKRRKVKSVTLTQEQRDRLECLWFYYGNYGPKPTPGNHSFIQRLLENGYDERSLYNKRTPKSEIPTPECVRAVEAILAVRSEPESPDERIRASGLRVVSNAEEHEPLNVDPEMKIIFEAMKCRYLAMHARPGNLVTEFPQHCFEPMRVSARFKADDYLGWQLRVKSADIIFLVMEITRANLAIDRVAVINSLDTSMKINSAIYCHPAPP